MKNKIWKYFSTINVCHNPYGVKGMAEELTTHLQRWEKEHPEYISTGRSFSLVNPSSIDDRFNDFCLAVEYELAER
jgi:hypothetical protein